MTNTYFCEMMEALGAKTVQNTALGLAGEYPYAAELENPGSDAARIAFRFLLEHGPAKVIALLDENPIPYVQWRAGGNLLFATLAPTTDFYAKSTAFSLLAAAEKALAKAGLHPPEACPLCGLAGCDRYAWLRGGFRKTHAACLAHRLDEAPDGAVNTEVSHGKGAKGAAGYLRGALGGLLGALVAAVPNWALALSQNRLSPLLYFLIPLFSTLLYRLFRGQKNRTFAGLTVLFSSLIAAFALELFWFWLQLSSGAGGVVPFAVSVPAYFAHHTLASALREMLWPLAFMVLGMLLAARLLRHYTGRETAARPPAKGIAFTRASALPIDANAGQHSAPPVSTSPPMSAPPQTSAPPPNSFYD